MPKLIKGSKNQFAAQLVGEHPVYFKLLAPVAALDQQRARWIAEKTQESWRQRHVYLSVVSKHLRQVDERYLLYKCLLKYI